MSKHVLRRTVARRLAELLGDQGDKLIKRVLGHSDGSVTAIYNRYGYVREMRKALEAWAAELLSMPMCVYSASQRDLFRSLIGTLTGDRSRSTDDAQVRSVISRK